MLLHRRGGHARSDHVGKGVFGKAAPGKVRQEGGLIRRLLATRHLLMLMMVVLRLL